MESASWASQLLNWLESADEADATYQAAGFELRLIYVPSVHS